MKYFVVSDVHGFYSKMRNALNVAGYDPKNPEHFLISCGDAFDRGLESNKILEFFVSLPDSNCAFVKGNHEEMLMQLLSKKREWTYGDIRNGTIDTIMQLSGVDNLRNIDYAIRVLNNDAYLQKYLSRLCNYYETETHVFVHGWIPRREKNDGTYSFTGWRGASKAEWYNARWCNGFDEWHAMTLLEEQGLSEPEAKTIVCGHWHTSYAHSKYHNKGIEFPVGSAGIDKCCFEPFVDDGIIGLDACTALTQKVNVYVFEE